MVGWWLPYWIGWIETIFIPAGRSIDSGGLGIYAEPPLPNSTHISVFWEFSYDPKY